MALQILLIQRKLIANSELAYSAIKAHVPPEPVLGPELLCWLCFCPPEALTISKIGPIVVAHGGAWAKARELESLHWPLLGGTAIHGKAVGLSRQQRDGEHEALSESEALHAQRVLARHCSALVQSCCPIHQAFEQGLPWDELVHFRASDLAGQAEIVQQSRQRRRALAMAAGRA
jgi:hypothetical protein